MLEGPETDDREAPKKVLGSLFLDVSVNSTIWFIIIPVLCCVSD